MSQFSKILVPIDFSDSSAEVLRVARQMAAGFGSDLTIIHVWHPPEFAGADLMVLAHAEGMSIGEYGRRQAGEQMQRFLELNAASDLPHRILVGEPRREILQLAERDQFELIVMGTHGRSGRARLFAGSVAEGVVRRAPCPVLTVRAEL